MAFNKGSTAKTSDSQTYTVNGLTGSAADALAATIVQGGVSEAESANQTSQYLAGTTGNVLNNLVNETQSTLQQQGQLVQNVAGLQAILAQGAVNAEAQTAAQAVSAVTGSVTSQLQAATGQPITQSSGIDWDWVFLGLAAAGIIITLIFTEHHHG